MTWNPAASASKIACSSVRRVVDEQTARRRLIRVRLEERRGRRAHRAVREDLDSADAQPVIAEAGHDSRLADAVDRAILDGIDARRQLAGCTQRLIGAKLGAAGRHVLQRRDAQRGGMPQSGTHLVDGLLERRLRHGADDEIHRAVLEDPGGMPRCIAHDRAARGRRRVARDPGQPHRDGVRQRHVAVEPLHEHGVIGCGRIDRVAGRKRAARPRLVIPIPAEDPAVPGQARRVGRQSRCEIPLVGGRTQIDADQFLGAPDEMDVRVVEAREHQPAAGINHPRRGGRHPPNLRIGADSRDSSGGDRDRLRRGPRRIHGVNLAVDHDQIDSAAHTATFSATARSTFIRIIVMSSC